MKKIYIYLLTIWCAQSFGQQILQTEPLELIESYTGYYNYTVTGGSLRVGADGTANACTIKSSDMTSLEGIPADATIKKAYLYWAGSGSRDFGSGYEGFDKEVTLAVNGTNHTPTPIRQYRSEYRNNDSNNSLLYHFSYTADITDIIEANRNSDYTISDFEVSTADKYCVNERVLAGWSIVVVYKDLNQTRQKKVNIYEGFDLSSYSQHFYNLSGLNVPDQAEGKVTGIFWEGDEKYAGGENGYSEILSLNGNPLTDEINPGGNAYNGTRSNFEFPASNSATEYGVDIDTYDVGPYLNEGDKVATLAAGTGRDMIITNTIVMAADTYTPEMNVTKTSDYEEAGKRLNIGDIITYTVEMTNDPNAQEPAYLINVEDQLPAGVEYIGPTNREYYINNSEVQSKTIPLTKFSDDNGTNTGTFSFDANGQYNSQMLTIPDIKGVEDLQTTSINLQIAGTTYNCNDLYLRFYGPSGLIKTYNYSDVCASNGTMGINETLTLQNTPTISGTPVGRYYLQWYDANNTVSGIDNYGITSQISITYEYRDPNARKKVTDTVNEKENIIRPSENIEIFPGETVKFTMQARVTDLNPFEKVNTVSFTADNFSDALTATATDKMAVCYKESPDGTPRTTQVGISTLNRNKENWLADDTQNKLGAYLVLESTKKGFAITQHTNPTEVQNPVEGMLIWDSTEQCLKIYQSDAISRAWSNCLQQSCNE
ncbi:DUF3344 domain-containing protein [Flavobacteriaceae bacterium Ap0902]|nr:DUF3344 domain-containing protein [Flavobacteriaceae bacterium Ap0902]